MARVRKATKTPAGKSTKRRRTPLTREQVLRAALALVDRGGVGALSMRKVAAKLGVEAMSLYKHVNNKEDLQHGLVEQVLSEMLLPPPGTPWRTAMRQRAQSARAVLLRHPGAAVLVESCVTMTPTRLHHADSVIGLLRDGGFSVTQAYRAFLTLDSYVYGFTLQELSWPKPDAKDTAPAFNAAAYPNFTAVMAEVMGVVADIGFGAAYDAEFDAGLEVVLDGLAQVLASCAQSTGAPSKSSR